MWLRDQDSERASVPQLHGPEPVTPDMTPVEDALLGRVVYPARAAILVSASGRTQDGSEDRNCQRLAVAPVPAAACYLPTIGLGGTWGAEAVALTFGCGLGLPTFGARHAGDVLVLLVRHDLGRIEHGVPFSWVWRPWQEGPGMNRQPKPTRLLLPVRRTEGDVMSDPNPPAEPEPQPDPDRETEETEETQTTETTKTTRTDKPSEP